MTCSDGNVAMKPYTTAKYTISLARPGYTGRKVTLAYFTDLHNCCNPEEAEELMKRITALHPDLVLCGGDSIVASPGKEVDGAVRFLQRIARQFPLAIGTGNHEYRARLYPETYGRMYDEYRKPLQHTENVYLLENTHHLFYVADLPICIYGFELPRYYYRRFRPHAVPVREISTIFDSPDKTAVSVLLSHNPASLPACLEWGADLTLSGHYHGGILRFGKHSGLISPEFRLFPNNVYGHFQNGAKHGIISSGCGEHTIPVRIHNPREVVGIHISITG